MSTNIITGFEIQNNLKITDGQLQLATNSSDVSLDICGNITIGTIEDATAYKLIVKNQDKAEINLISKNVNNVSSTQKISNKNGGLLFESENTGINYTRYEFDVGGGESVGIMKGFDDNVSGIIFGKNSSEANGITTYHNAHISYKHNGTGLDDSFLSLTGETMRFNIGTGNYNTPATALTIDSSGNVGVATANPETKLHIKGGRIKIEGEGEETAGVLELFNSTGQTNYIFTDGISGNLILQTYNNKDTIFTGGNVGIGTTSPNNILNIQVPDGANYNGLFINDSTSNFVELGKDNENGTGYLRLHNAGDFATGIFLHGNGDSYIMGGKLGIGITTPTAKLNLKGDYNTGHWIKCTYPENSWAQVALYNDTYFFSTENTGSVEHFNEVKIGPGGIGIGYEPPSYTRGGVDSLVCSGRVGIGTTSPIRKLHIMGSITTQIDSDADNFIELKSNSKNAYVLNKNGVLSLRTENSNHLLLNDTGGGNVGIGTTSPNNKLDVNGGISVYNSFIQSTYVNGTYITMTSQSSTNKQFELKIRDDTTSSYPLHIGPGTGFDGINIKHSNGNVGIGTNNPKSALTVSGLINSSPKQAGVHLGTEANGNTAIEICANSVGYSYIDFNCTSGGNDDHNGRILYSNSGNYMSFSTSTTHAMTINSSGNIGIGTSTPQYGPLHIYGSGGQQVMLQSSNSWVELILYGHSDSYITYQERLRFWRGSDVLVLGSNKYVGIGTNAPGYPLHVMGYTLNNAHGYKGLYESSSSVSSGYNYVGLGYTTAYSTNIEVSIYAQEGIWCGSIVTNSDTRIKENIRDVSDIESLQKLRDISCVKYEYKDKITRGFDTTIGFIAQQVREHLPMAVSIQKEIIPNEMRNIENPQWTTLTDSSGNNTYKLTISDLSDNSGNTLYRFHVSNEPSGNDECQKQSSSLIDDPKSFIFEEKWNNVFLYGKQVYDFHVLDKHKLFALNFSASQELDKNQQKIFKRIEILENNNQLTETLQQQSETLQQQSEKINTLESNLKNKENIITELSNKLNKQNRIIANLETQIQILLNRVTQLEINQ